MACHDPGMWARSLIMPVCTDVKDVLSGTALASLMNLRKWYPSVMGPRRDNFDPLSRKRPRWAASGTSPSSSTLASTRTEIVTDMNDYVM